MSREVFLGLDETVASPSVARDVVSRALDRWGITDKIDTVVLLVSELVTNAVLHGRSSPELKLAWDGTTIRVEVSDTNELPALRMAAPGLKVAGRGLGLVEDMSSEWGSYSDERGHKVVWFELRVADPAQA
ncbi:MAG: ATP-binding protein [Acidimicrobiales bacterium]